MDTKLIDT